MSMQSTPLLAPEAAAAPSAPSFGTLLKEFQQELARLQHVDYRLTEGLTALYATLPIRLPLPPMRGWPISPDFAAIMVAEILGHRPTLVVEAGSGISSLLIGYALEKLGQGRAVCLDHEAVYAERTRALLRMHELDHRVEVVHAPLTTAPSTEPALTWYDTAGLADLGNISMLVIDGPPSATGPQARYPALPLLRDRLAPRCRVLLDDGGRPEEVQAAKRWLGEGYGFKQVTTFDCEKGAVLLER
jgi:hypothetical protein